MGKEDEGTFQTYGTFTHILSKASLRMKAVACSGQEDGAKLEKLGGSVLGHSYRTEKDRVRSQLVGEHL